MESLCGMCGERQSNQGVCRTDDRNDRWSVCDECAQLMLNSPDLTAMWMRTEKGETATFGFVNLLERWARA